jgi:putative copper export protein
MNEKLAILAARKQQLIQKAALQRLLIAQNMQSLHQPITMADRGLQVLRYFRQYPVLMIGVSSLSGILIRRLQVARFTALLQTGWSVFQLVRDVRESIRKK